MLDKNSELLLNHFKDIANKGWIQEICNGNGSIGLTFESELNKEPDNRYSPDYLDIEIKCTGSSNSFPITFFSISFDGPTFPEISRIVDKYGYYDKIYSRNKRLSLYINNRKEYIYNKQYIFKLETDYVDKKIYLCVYDVNNDLIERKSYIYLYNLYNHINYKIKKLAIIYGRKKISNNVRYFKYYKICIYKLKSKEMFLKALNDGIISAQLAVTMHKNGEKKGKQRNKNLCFFIDKNNIKYLFDEICVYDK